jgi:hypothetical protein
MTWTTCAEYGSLETGGRRLIPAAVPGLANTTHPRRALDQFYYPALDDTSARDADQTISKWSGKGLDRDGREHAVNDSLLILVDQLWCWVVDERKLFLLQRFRSLMRLTMIRDDRYKFPVSQQSS